MEEEPNGIANGDGSRSVDQESTSVPAPFRQAFGRRKLDWLNISQRGALPAIWVLAIVFFSIVEPKLFLTTRNFQTIFSFQSTTLVLALGLILPLTTRDFDLSIAANLGFSSMLVAVLNVTLGIPAGWCVVVVIIAGLMIGAINAVIVVVFEVNAFIVTLATGTILSGMTLAISGQATIGGVSPGLVAFSNRRIDGLTTTFYIAILLAIALWYLLDFTPVGRRLLFVGMGTEVARLSGVRVARLRWGALIGAGGIAAIAGVLNVGITGAADPTSSASFLLPAYAAAFLGATTISPGRFNVWGTVVTVYFLVTGFTGLQLLGIASWIQQVFYGGALVIAVALGQLAARRRRDSPTA